MTPWDMPSDIEEEDESLPRIISMRRKVAAATMAYILCLATILLASSPGIADCYYELAGIDGGSSLEEAIVAQLEPDFVGTNATMEAGDGVVETSESGEDDQSSDLPVYDVRDTIFYDDFLEDQNAWNWRQRKFTIRDGCVFLNITANRSGDACSILRDGYLKHAGFETRLRTSSLEVPMLAFGFYESHTGIQFMWFSNHSTEATRGLHAFCEIDDLTAFWEPIEINITDWHVYTIIWEPGNATFIIDGEIVARTDQVPNDALEICLYCLCKASSAETLAIGSRADCGNLPGIRLLNDQYTQIDYIEIFEVEGV